MGKLFYINAKNAVERLPYILSRKGPVLFGLNGLAEMVRNEFLRSRKQELRLDFITGKAAFEISIPARICSALKKQEVRALTVMVNPAIFKLNPSDFPDKALRVAIKYALRELATNGMPRSPIKIDLSSNRGTERRGDFQIGLKVDCHAKLSRVSLWEAILSFSYKIDAGGIPISIVRFERKIDE